MIVASDIPHSSSSAVISSFFRAETFPWQRGHGEGSTTGPSGAPYEDLRAGIPGTGPLCVIRGMFTLHGHGVIAIIPGFHRCAQSAQLHSPSKPSIHNLDLRVDGAMPFGDGNPNPLWLELRAKTAASGRGRARQ
jgi:hypothetical protein